MTDFTWDLCPRCNATGRVSEQCYMLGGTGMSDRTAPFVVDRDCDACDGLGRVKVPAGYRLMPETTAVTITTAGTKNLSWQAITHGIEGPAPPVKTG